MRRCVLALIALLSACSTPEKPAAAPTVAAPEPPKITQLYSSLSVVPKGGKSLVCYGVENATTVWMEPPRKELSPAQARCVEVSPERDTTYKITATNAEGKSVTGELKISVGTAPPKILNVNVSALEVKAGDLVSVCYKVENAKAVEVSPIGYHGGAKSEGCATDQPHESKTYVVKAIGAGGEKDEEKVTVKVTH
jgi:hypothetical protein